jgi:hypothetical protein
MDVEDEAVAAVAPVVVPTDPEHEEQMDVEDEAVAAVAPVVVPTDPEHEEQMAARFECDIQAKEEELQALQIELANTQVRF